MRYRPSAAASLQRFAAAVLRQRGRRACGGRGVSWRGRLAGDDRRPRRRPRTVRTLARAGDGCGIGPRPVPRSHRRVDVVRWVPRCVDNESVATARHRSRREEQAREQRHRSQASDQGQDGKGRHGRQPRWHQWVRESTPIGNVARRERQAKSLLASRFATASPSTGGAGSRPQAGAGGGAIPG